MYKSCSVQGLSEGENVRNPKVKSQFAEEYCCNLMCPTCVHMKSSKKSHIGSDLIQFQCAHTDVIMSLWIEQFHN